MAPTVKNLTVRFLDGTEESIQINLLPVRAYCDLDFHFSNEARLIEIYARKDSAWVDALTPDSAIEILTAGEEINMGHFEKHKSLMLKNRMAQAELILILVNRVAPGLKEQSAPVISFLKSIASSQ
jgi:predicted LPLAT superfamily acyltransferase